MLDEETKKAIEEAVQAAMGPVIKSATEAIDGLKKNRDDILAEKKAIEAAERNRKTKGLMDAADRLLKGENGTDNIPDGVLRADDQNLYVARSKVLAPQEYQRLKAVAAEQGKNLRIMDDMSSRTVQDASPVVHRFEHKGTTYLSAAYIDEIGGPSAYARLKDQNPGTKFMAFRDLNGLSPEAVAAHDQAMNGGDDE